MPLEEFNAFRQRMNDAILGAGNLTINRFFALDHQCYEPGALGSKTKEMLGLVSSLVLRCGIPGDLLGGPGRRREHRQSPSAPGHGTAGGTGGVAGGLGGQGERSSNQRVIAA